MVGDKIEFAGSNWYVIKDSSKSDDYIALMKEKVLTNSELGEYAANYIMTFTIYQAANGIYGCTKEGGIVTIQNDTMTYNWSDTCHSSGTYRCTERKETGCARHNDYEGSKVKEFLEGTYINTIGSDNLKEVDSYKVSLLTKDELYNNLGCVNANGTDNSLKNAVVEDNNVPIWIYQDIGNNNEDHSYWTMAQI